MSKHSVAEQPGSNDWLVGYWFLLAIFALWCRCSLGCAFLTSVALLLVFGMNCLLHWCFGRQVYALGVLVLIHLCPSLVGRAIICSEY